MLDFSEFAVALALWEILTLSVMDSIFPPKTPSHQKRGLQSGTLSQDADWSVYQEVSGEKVPYADSCLTCHELWREAFSFLAWDALIKQQNEARQVKQGKQSAALIRQNVNAEIAVAVIVEKTFLGVRERYAKAEWIASHSSFFP